MIIENNRYMVQTDNSISVLIFLFFFKFYTTKKLFEIGSYSYVPVKRTVQKLFVVTNKSNHI